MDPTAIFLEMIHLHHDWEGDSYFPALEALVEPPRLLGDNCAGHSNFEPGLKRFLCWCQKKEGFSDEKYRDMMNAFAPTMKRSMDKEPETLID